jgi:ABC-type transport system involved in multi-copper enzyme maturation permease subunit
MIRQILRKEVLMNILSLRFVLSLLLAISLFAASGFVFVNRYEKQSQDYWKKTNENLEGLNGQTRQLYRLAFYKQSIWRKPKPLALCTDGFERSLPDCIRCDAFTSDLPEIRGQRNFILPHLSDIDWVFIISMILSFIALVFTYDSISGEREDGTLRQMLANTVPRYQVLLGKYIGVIITIGIPLLIGLLVSLIIVVASNVAVFGGLDWLKILTVVLLSFLYLSIFIFLGMFISSRTAHSANSMVILLLLWVCLIILIPSFGRIISDLSSKSTTEVELQRRLEEASKKVSEKADAGTFGDNPGSMSTDRDHPMNNPLARSRYKTAGVNARNQVIEEHHRRLLAQVFQGQNFTCLSPIVIYRRASEVIAGTGINHCVNLLRQVKEYQTNLKEYIRAKDAEDPDSLHLIFPEEGCAQSWRAISHNPVDFATVPKFQERDQALGRSLKLAIWDIGLLMLFNLVFFVASYVSFLKYDVR